MAQRSALSILVALATLACNAEEPPGSTGGSNQAPGPCGRGLVVVGTDYQSTNVSLLGFDGVVLSSSFVSSATAGAKVSAQLSGDVVLPSQSAVGAEIVLIDRYPASVLSWVRVQDAEIERQLSVRTGFAANPQDYLAISANKAYVTRLDSNPDTGQEPFDGGADVLIVDPSLPAISARLDLAPAMQGEPSEYFASPSRALLIDDTAFVLLQGYSKDFKSSAPSRVVRIDTAMDTIAETLVLSGLHGCAGLSLSPDGKQLAVICSGEFAGSSTPSPDKSGVVIVGLEGSLSEQLRLSADFAQGPLGFAAAWVSDETLLVTAFGSLNRAGALARPDRVYEVSLVSGAAREILSSTDQAFSLGDVRCAPTCGACFVTDADRNVVHRFVVEQGSLASATRISVDTTIGLPPRVLGAF